MEKEFAEASYESNPPTAIDGFELVHSDGTLKFYRRGQEIVVAVRGTADAADLAADASIAVGALRSSHRYRHDADILRDFQERFPRHLYTYRGVGHSLGGALIDQFLKDGYLSKGVSFNPAIQPGSVHSENQRIYHPDDPLYALEGRFARGSSTTGKKRSLLEHLYGLSPLGRIYQGLKAHQLSNF
jgi:hypothetical protein